MQLSIFHHFQLDLHKQYKRTVLNSSLAEHERRVKYAASAIKKLKIKLEKTGRTVPLWVVQGQIMLRLKGGGVAPSFLRLWQSRSRRSTRCFQKPDQI